MAVTEQGLSFQLLILYFCQDLVKGTLCKLTGPLVSYTTCRYGCCNETASHHICCEYPSLTDEMIWGLVICLAIIFLIIGCIVSIGCRKGKISLNNQIVLSTTPNMTCSYINSGAVTTRSCESSLNLQFHELSVSPPQTYDDLPPSYESIVAEKNKSVDGLDV